LKPTAKFALKLQSLGPVERFGRAVDRFLVFAFFLPAIITSVLPAHSAETALQSQERIYEVFDLKPTSRSRFVL
jgi:hypothetical protein